MTPKRIPLRREIMNAVNRCNAENASNTPDFILALFLVECLDAFDRAVLARAKWYGRMDSISGEEPVP